MVTDWYPDAMGLLIKFRDETYAEDRKNFRFLRARTYKEYLEFEEVLGTLTATEARDLAAFRRSTTTVVAATKV